MKSQQFQIMVICGATFILGVLTCYTFYRYMCEQTEFFKDLPAIHVIWITFFCVLMLIVIHFGSVLAREVSFCLSMALNSTKMSQMKLNETFSIIPLHV